MSEKIKVEWITDTLGITQVETDTRGQSQTLYKIVERATPAYVITWADFLGTREQALTKISAQVEKWTKEDK